MFLHHTSLQHRRRPFSQLSLYLSTEQSPFSRHPFSHSCWCALPLSSPTYMQNNLHNSKLAYQHNFVMKETGTWGKFMQSHGECANSSPKIAPMFLDLCPAPMFLLCHCSALEVSTQTLSVAVSWQDKHFLRIPTWNNPGLWSCSNYKITQSECWQNLVRWRAKYMLHIHSTVMPSTRMSRVRKWIVMCTRMEQLLFLLAAA